MHGAGNTEVLLITAERRCPLFRNLLLLTTGLVASLVISGCSTRETPQAEPEPSASPLPANTKLFENGLLTFVPVVSADGSQTGSTAQLEGPLAFVDGCVVIGTTPIAVPEPADWDGTTLTAFDSTFAIGDVLSLGGGYIRDAVLPDNTVDGCKKDLPFFAGTNGPPS